MSRETLRKWMTKAAYWCPRRQRVKKIYVWRERRASFGELVMQDSSPFRWLEKRGPACQLIAVIDDATSRIYGSFYRTRQHGGELANVGGMAATLRTAAGPITRTKTAYSKPHRRPEMGEQLRGEEAHTQFGRALKELGIEGIAAHSPQAKGRIERLFETLQDRLVKEMRLAGIDSIAAANHFLETRFLPEWEQRFTVTARNPRNAHRRLGRGTAPGRNPERARGAPSGRRSHRKLGGEPLGSAAGRSLRGTAGSEGGDRTAAGRFKSLVAFPESLSTSASLPRTVGAARKSFRPTASRTCGKEAKNRTTRANPNTMCLPNTLGENHGSVYFYLAQTRTFLL